MDKLKLKRVAAGTFAFGWRLAVTGFLAFNGGRMLYDGKWALSALMLLACAAWCSVFFRVRVIKRGGGDVQG
jgi:hypothetical protein